MAAGGPSSGVGRHRFRHAPIHAGRLPSIASPAWRRSCPNTALSVQHRAELSDGTSGLELTPRLVSEPIDHLAMDLGSGHAAAIRPRGKKPDGGDHGPAGSLAAAIPARPDS